jgi:hypothetical protein
MLGANQTPVNSANLNRLLGQPYFRGRPALANPSGGPRARRLLTFQNHRVYAGVGAAGIPGRRCITRSTRP